MWWQCRADLWYNVVLGHPATITAFPPFFFFLTIHLLHPPCLFPPPASPLPYPPPTQPWWCMAILIHTLLWSCFFSSLKTQGLAVKHVHACICIFSPLCASVCMYLCMFDCMNVGACMALVTSHWVCVCCRCICLWICAACAVCLCVCANCSACISLCVSTFGFVFVCMFVPVYLYISGGPTNSWYKLHPSISHLSLCVLFCVHACASSLHDHSRWKLLFFATLDVSLRCFFFFFFLSSSLQVCSVPRYCKTYLHS